jgi:hypothetical protein
LRGVRSTPKQSRQVNSKGGRKGRPFYYPM